MGVTSGSDHLTLLWILYPPDVISVTETCFWKVKNDLLIYKAKVYRFDRL